MSRQLSVVSCGYVLLIIFSNVPAFLDATSGNVSAPLLLLVSVLLSAVLAVFNPKDVLAFLKSDVAKLTLTLAVLYVANWFWVGQGTTGASVEEIEHAGRRIRQLLILPSAAFIIFLSGPRTIKTWALLAIVTVPMPIIVDFYVPELLDAYFPVNTNVFDSLRAAGLHLNANQAAEAVILWLLILQSRVRGFLLLICFLVGSVAVIHTFSRSGLGGVILLGAYLIYAKKIPKISLAIPVMVAIFYSTIVVQMEDVLTERIDSEQQVTSLLDRFQFFSTLSGGTSTQFSDEERESIVADSFSLILERPLFGYGRETTFMLGLASHNFLIDIWFTYGVFGLLVYLYMLVLLLRSGKGKGYGIVNPYFYIFLWFTPFDHAQLSANSWLVFYGCVLSMYGAGAKRSNFSDNFRFQPKRAKRRRSKRRKSNLSEAR